MFFTEVFLNHLKEARYSYKTIKDYSYLLQTFENYFQIREVSKIQNVSQEIIYGFFEMINLTVTNHIDFTVPGGCIPFQRLWPGQQFLNQNLPILLIIVPKHIFYHQEV